MIGKPITMTEACDMAQDVMTEAERDLAEERAAEGELRYPYKPDCAVPPGRTIRELSNEKGLGDYKLGIQLGLIDSWLQGLFVGAVAVTPRVAKKLAEIFEPTAQFWLNAEANYRTTLARLAREKAETPAPFPEPYSHITPAELSQFSQEQSDRHHAEADA